MNLAIKLAFVLVMPVAFFTLIAQLCKSRNGAPDELVNATAPFVCRQIPERQTNPVKLAVVVPLIVTLGLVTPSLLKASQSKALRFTPAFNEIFSVYVPGIMKMVSPEVAEAIALAIVVCVPFVLSVTEAPNGSTIHLAGLIGLSMIRLLGASATTVLKEPDCSLTCPVN